MSKIAYRIIDVLVVLLIILNVLAFDIPIAGINLRYIVFALLLLSSFIVKPSLYFSKHSTYFVTVVLLFYAAHFAADKFTAALTNNIAKK